MILIIVVALYLAYNYDSVFLKEQIQNKIVEHSQIKSGRSLKVSGPYDQNWTVLERKTHSRSKDRPLKRK